MFMEVDELWIAHYSASSWRDENLWINFFRQVQEILGSPITHLDTNDPVRRKAKTLTEIGSYITSFKAAQRTRWVFGKVSNLGIEFQVEYHDQVENSPNSLLWYIPLKRIEDSNGLAKVLDLFKLGNECLNTFYSYSDLVSEVRKKKKSTGAVDLQREIIGVFWLNYFNKAYVSFYGKSNFERIASTEMWLYEGGGLSIKLADTPFKCDDNARKSAEKVIGKQYFVDPQDLSLKPEGQFALLLSQLC